MKTHDDVPLGGWVRRFLLEHLVVERNLSRNTQHSYRDTLRLLIPFVADHHKTAVDRLVVTDVSADVVRGFLRHVEERRGCGVRTRNQRLAAIHALATFIGERCPELIPWCGEVRAGDLDMRSDGSGSVRLVGKGGKTRHCPLWPVTMTSLRALTSGRSSDEPVFRNRQRAPITRFVVHATVARYVTDAAIACPSLAKKAISPHVIRHTTATHLLRAGVDINTIRAWLGHVSIDTTNVYAEVDLETKAQMLAACGSFTAGKAPARRWRNDPSLMQFLRSL